MKYSRQRELIRDFVSRELVHPTADYVYSQVKLEQPNISLGTVYRNLNLLAEMGEIRKISLPNQSDRFDGRLDDHQHLLCQRCGEVYDLELPHLRGLAGYILDTSGFAVEHYDLIITGTCKNCGE